MILKKLVSWVCRWQKISLLLVLFCICSVELQAQRYDWLENIRANKNLIIRDVETKGKFIYIAGAHEGTVYFGNDSVADQINLTDVPTAFIAKMDTLGNFQWFQTFPDLTWPHLKDFTVVTDFVLDGNEVYLHLLGRYGVRVGNIDHRGPNISVIVKMDARGGSIIWSSSFKTSYSVISSASFPRPRYISAKGKLLVNENGDLVLATNFRASTTPGNNWFNYNSTRVYYPILSGDGVIIMHINSNNGNYLYSDYIGNYTDAGSNSAANFSDMETDTEGNIYVTGIGVNKVSMDSTTMAMNRDIFLVKINKRDSLVWMRKTNWKNSSSDREVNVDNIELDQAGNIYLMGSTLAVLEYDSLESIGQMVKSSNGSLVHQRNPYLLKIDSNGRGKFLKTFEVDTAARRGFNYVHDVYVDQSNYIYGIGVFDRLIKFNNRLIASNGRQDAFYFKMDSTGKVLWLETAGGAASDFGDHIIAHPTKEQFYIAGRFSGLSTFGSILINSQATTTDGFIAKIEECKAFTPKITPSGFVFKCFTDSVVANSPTIPKATYQWIRNNKTITGQNFPALHITKNGSYKVEVNDNGCIGTSRVATITIGQRKPRVTLNLNIDSLCVNEDLVQLSGGNHNNGRYFGNGVDAKKFDASIAGVGSHQISFEVDSFGCKDTATATVEVLDIPDPQITGLKAVCENALGVTYNANTNGLDYHWSVIGGNITSGQGTRNITVDWSDSSFASISLEETNTDSCSNSITDTIDIANVLIQDSIVGEDTVCGRSQTYWYAVASPAIFYSWLVQGGSIVAGQGTDRIQVRWTQIGSANLAVRIFNVCGTDSTLRDTVWVKESPISTFVGPTSACQGDSAIYLADSSNLTYQWNTFNAATIYNSWNDSSLSIRWDSAGMREVQLITMNTEQCTDTTTLNVDITALPITTIKDSLCLGDTFLFHGTALTMPGSYWDTIQRNNLCDSLVNLNLSIKANSFGYFNAFICEGESYLYNGNSLSTSGAYYDTLLAANSCDSIVELTLFVLSPISDTIANSICLGDTFFFAGSALTTAGYYTDSAISRFGCDSVTTIDLTVLASPFEIRTETICQGESYHFGGRILTQGGVYTNTESASNGCDSTVRLTLNVLQTYNQLTNKLLCPGDTFNFLGRAITQEGLYRDTLMASNGCDSILRLRIELDSIPPTTTIDTSICEGERVFFRGQFYNQSGIYLDTFLTPMSCRYYDSLVLTVDSTIRIVYLDTICEGQQYTFGGKLLTKTGIYSDTLSSAMGCDSIESLQLTVKAISRDTIYKSICLGGNYVFNGKILNVAGSYMDTLINGLNCDSIIRLELDVQQSIQINLNETICLGDSFAFDGRNLKQTGIYNRILKSQLGCDSLIEVLNLTVSPNFSRRINRSICNGDTLWFNQFPLTRAGIYQDTIFSSNCDTIIELDLTIDPAISDSVTVDRDTLIAYENQISYQWLRCNSNNTFTVMVGETQKRFVVPDNNFYAVEVSENSCIDTSTCVQRSQSVGIEEHGSSNKFEIIPNPSNGRIQINIELEQTSDISIEIRGLNGNLLYSETRQLNTSNWRHELDLSGAAKGLYFVHFNSDKSHEVKKLILH